MRVTNETFNDRQRMSAARSAMKYLNFAVIFAFAIRILAAGSAYLLFAIAARNTSQIDYGTLPSLQSFSRSSVPVRRFHRWASSLWRLNICRQCFNDVTGG